MAVRVPDADCRAADLDLPARLGEKGTDIGESCRHEEADHEGAHVDSPGTHRSEAARQAVADRTAGRDALEFQAAA